MEVQQINYKMYFVSNRMDNVVTTVCKFRVTGKQPELWHPVTGKICALPEYTDAEGVTGIPLKFDVYEGYFIVFRDKACKPSMIRIFRSRQKI